MTPPPAENFAARIFLGPALRAQPDRRLVDLVRDGYDAAFEEIVRRYRRPLDRFAAAIVGGRSEDVTQDAFSKALLALRGSEAEIELRPWLYRIVRNTALNDLRDQAPAATELSETLPGGRSAAAEAEAREELAELMDRVRALPEPQRAALVMRELEGLSHEEIAAALGVSGGAARQAIHRARTALRDGLGLLLPLPVLRALIEHGGEAAAAGGAIAAGAGASTAGGAALGGLGGGAVKAGVATLLVAGTVGAGVAVQHERGRDGVAPPAAEAAVSPAGGSGVSAASTAGSGPGPALPTTGSSGGGDGPDDRGSEGRGRNHDEDGNRGRGGRREESVIDDSNHGRGGPGPGGRSGHGDRGDDRGDDGGGGRGRSGDDGSGSGRSGSSGHGSGGDGGSGSGSSGSGHGGEGSDDGSGDSSGKGSGSAPESSTPSAPEPPPLDSGDGGSSGDGSGSGSGSSSGSGSGSGGDDGEDDS